MGNVRTKDGSCNDLRRVIQDDRRKPPTAPGTRIGQERHGCGRLQQCLQMARMAKLGSRLASLSSSRPSLAFVRGCLCRGRPTGVGRVPMETGFEVARRFKLALTAALRCSQDLMGKGASDPGGAYPMLRSHLCRVSVPIRPRGCHWHLRHACNGHDQLSR
jgi:hypothetical protein